MHAARVVRTTRALAASRVKRADSIGRACVLSSQQVTIVLSPHLALKPLNPAYEAATVALCPGQAKTIGRSTAADVTIDDASLSRMHLRVVMREPGTLFVEDLGSTNGIYINGVRERDGTLAIGDRLRVGRIDFMVETGPDVTPPPPAGKRPSEPPAWEPMTRVAFAPDLAKNIDRVALEGLLATSRELMACSDLDSLLDHVLDRLGEILRPDRSAILFYDAATDRLNPRAVRPAGAYTSVSQFASATIVREALASRQAMSLVDLGNDARFQRAESVMIAGVRSAVCAPLLGRNGPIGAIYADRLTGLGGFGLDALQYVTAFAAHTASALERAMLYADREALFRATLEAFAKTLDARDKYTRGHSERVTAYTLTLARAIDLDAASCEVIRRAGLLHDIGKVGVPDAVLQKKGRLTKAERRQMEQHVVIGYEMLTGLTFLKECLPAIRGHHERWDGKGYPDQLAGDKIHLHARLMAVADAFDAMTSDRPYRSHLPIAEAIRRVRTGSGQQFDPAAVEAFNHVEAEFLRIHAEQAR
jgi:putative nucleotidyltransferase with HDIG domain